MKKYLIEPGQNQIKLTDSDIAELGSYDVKVSVKAASLNYRDILTRQYTRKHVVPFSDGAGEVIAVGDKVATLKIGDRVTGLFFPTWLDGELNQTILRSVTGLLLIIWGGYWLSLYPW